MMALFDKFKKGNEAEKDDVKDDEEDDVASLLRKAIDKELERSGGDEVEDETRGIKEPKVADMEPVLQTGEAGVGNDEVDFSLLDDIVTRSIKPVNLKEKIRLYWIYILVFSLIIGLVVVAFWESIFVRGVLSWDVGLAVGLLISFFVYIWAVEFREKVDKRYLRWYDVNSRYMFNFREIGEKDGYLLIMPFIVYKQRVYVPDNPFSAGAPLVVAIDTKAIRKNVGGMVTLGKLSYDGTRRATFRLDYDVDYIPNPDITNLMFELSIVKSKLVAEKELRVETDIKYRGMRNIKFDNEFQLLMKHIQQLIPTLSLMLRSKEQDIVSDMAVMDKLSETMPGLSKDRKQRIASMLKEV